MSHEKVIIHFSHSIICTSDEFEILAALIDKGVDSRSSVHFAKHDGLRALLDNKIIKEIAHGEFSLTEHGQEMVPHISSILKA